MSQNCEPVSGVEKESRDRVKLIRSAGKCAENCKIQDDNKKQNGNEVEGAGPHVIVVVAPAEGEGAITGLDFAVVGLCRGH